MLHKLPQLILIGLLFTLIGFSACNSSKSKSNLDDGSLEGKRAALTEKKDLVTALKADIKKLEKEIATLDPSSVKKEKVVSVSTIKVEPQDYEEHVEVFGTIETKGNYMATSEMPGVLTTMNYKEGDLISKGSLVATIDGQSFDNSKAEIELQLNLAKDVFQRRERLWKQNIGSEMEYLTAKNNVEALEKSLVSLATQVSKTNVYAPAGGVVERVNIHQGELASPGVPIINIISTANVQVVADISEQYLSVIKKGDRIQVEIPALDIERSAKITNIGTLINPANRTFKIEAQISNSDRKLKPNLQAAIKIKQFGQKDAIVIPTNIILREKGEEYVYVVDSSGEKPMAKKQSIKSDRSFDGNTLIVAGLTGEEAIISDGKNLVKDGVLVKTP